MYKVSRGQKAEYAKRFVKRDEICYGTPYAIREGCIVKFYNLGADKIQIGKVIRHSYGEKTGQHTFTLDVGDCLIRIKGRNLYPAVIKHERGAQSILANR